MFVLRMLNSPSTSTFVVRAPLRRFTVPYDYYWKGMHTRKLIIWNHKMKVLKMIARLKELVFKLHLGFERVHPK